jgi:transcriptional regulator with XRE-family HTH domain
VTASVTNRGAQLLRQWRGDRQQKDVLGLLGIDEATYSRFEKGKRKPSATVALRIFKVTDDMVPVGSWYESAEAEAKAS